MTAILPPLRPDRGLPVPEGVLDPRRRERLTSIGPGWPERGRMGVPAGGARAAQAMAAGARREPDGRLSVARAHAVQAPLQPYVPLLARREFVPLRLEPIPASSWGGSLQNLLTPESWEALCRDAIDRAGHVCQCCGEGGGAIECHEVWEYRTPGSEVVWGVQSLKGLLALCEGCHALFHPGLARDEASREALRQRAMAVNGWTADEERTFSEWAAAVTRVRSRYRWLLDLGGWAGSGPIEVDERYWMPDAEFGGVMADHDRLGRIRTKIVGAPWWFDGVERPAEPAEPHVERAENSLVEEAGGAGEACRRAGAAEMRWQGLTPEEWAAVTHHAGEMRAGRIDADEFLRRALRSDWEGYVVWLAGILAGRGLLDQSLYANASVDDLAARGEVRACMEGAETEFMRMCRERGCLAGARAA